LVSGITFLETSTSISSSISYWYPMISLTFSLSGFWRLNFWNSTSLLTMMKDNILFFTNLISILWILLLLLSLTNCSVSCKVTFASNSISLGRFNLHFLWSRCLERDGMQLQSSVLLDILLKCIVFHQWGILISSLSILVCDFVQRHVHILKMLLYAYFMKEIWTSLFSLIVLHFIFSIIFKIGFAIIYKNEIPINTAASHGIVSANRKRKIYFFLY